MNAPMLTLVGRLRRWAQERGAHRAVILLADGEAESAALTFAELDARARSIAAQLAALGARQKPVLLLCPSEIDFVASFVGCLYAGAIAVPAPTQLRSNLAARIAMVAQDAVPAVIIAADASRPVLKALALRQPVLWLDEAESSAPFIPDVSPNETAFIQYSSGSTASPKGIAITHGNLIANLEMFCAGFGVHNGSCFVNWLPLFHDMGLVGHCLAALYQGVACVMVPPLMFRQRPERWVEAMARYGGTISGAPNFAFELCARRAARLEGTPLDLHRWETAFCGAEMIRAPTMERFATALAPFGFRAAALTPAYGLAEATLFVASRPKGQGVATQRRERAGQVRQIVSCGQTASAETIRIVDPAAALPLPDGEEGEIWVKGPHIAAGSWRRASETAA
ncbi:MAG TPA: AMP-binding protein, partial [Stellaceae bacterium]|nr:AMP-binding protein [Stellaceae bacterium]